MIPERSTTGTLADPSNQADCCRANHALGVMMEMVVVMHDLEAYNH